MIAHTGVSANWNNSLIVFCAGLPRGLPAAFIIMTVGALLSLIYFFLLLIIYFFWFCVCMRICVCTLAQVFMHAPTLRNIILFLYYIILLLSFFFFCTFFKKLYIWRKGFSQMSQPSSGIFKIDTIVMRCAILSHEMQRLKYLCVDERCGQP